MRREVGVVEVVVGEEVLTVHPPSREIVELVTLEVTGL